MGTQGIDRLSITTIAHGSEEYRQAVQLRQRILRSPLGLGFSQAELNDEHQSLHIACYKESTLAGCLILKPLEGNVVQMRQVAVAQNLQGQGIGKCLVEYAEKLARTKAFSEIILHARTTAMPFYEKLGYKIRGEYFEEVGIRHITMYKQLTESSKG